MEIRELLALNTEELRSALCALNGEYVPPEAGGDLLRDGSGVRLPRLCPITLIPAYLDVICMCLCLYLWFRG